MTGSSTARSAAGPAAWLTLTTALACVANPNTKSPPGYDAFQPPPAGGRYLDPAFGSTITRVSDALETVDDATGSGKVAFIANEYSSMSPFNQDNSLLLLVHQSYFGLYDGAGRFSKNLPFEISASSQPRWSRRHPGLLYYVTGNQLKQYDTTAGAASVAHAFPEYSAISGHGESDICFDGDHLVLAGDSREIFVYEISTGHKGPVLGTGGRGFDSLYITPDDHVTVTWLERGSGRYQGIELFDRDMNFLRQVTRAGGHMDVTRDAGGDEVLVWANAGDRQPVCKNGVVKVRLADGQQTCLLSLDWSLALHVSAPDGGGWAVVSTYAPGDPRPPGGWKPYTNEIVQVSLDGSEIRRLAHHRSRPLNDYWWMPRASTSRDGSRLVYTSNCAPANAARSWHADAYLMTLGESNSARAAGGRPSALADTAR